MCLIYFTLRDRSVLEGGGVPSKLSALQNISKMPMKEKKIGLCCMNVIHC